MKISLNPKMSTGPKIYIWTVEIITAILIILWIYVGTTKLIEFRSFRLQMLQSPIFGSYYKGVTFGAPILELIIALLLIFKVSRQIGLYASFILMTFFSWYVYYLMTTLPELPCSCGGIISSLNWPQHLSLNIVLAILALCAVILNKKNKQYFRKNNLQYQKYSD